MRRTVDQRPVGAGDEMARRRAPSQSRAAAAARLAGAPSSSEAVRRRLSEAAQRAQQVAGSGSVSHPAAAGPVPSGRSGRPSRQGQGASDGHSSPAARPARSAGTRTASPVARGSGAGGGRSPSRGTQRSVRAIADPSAAAGAFSSGAAGLAAAPAPRREPRPAEESRPRHLRVVEPRASSARQRRRRARAFLLAGIGAVSVIAFALVYLHVVLAQRQFRIDRINAQVTKAETSYQNLRLHVAELGSPQQIVSTAEGRLGMIQPQKVMYLTPQSVAANSGTRTGQTSQSSGATGTAGGGPAASAGSASAGTGSTAASGGANGPAASQQPTGAP